MDSILFFSLFFLFFFHSASTSAIHSNETDRSALLEFKASIHDPLGAMTSWNNSIHFCQWYGVTCGRRYQRVTTLSLGSLALSGSISPHIGNLTFLKYLALHNNSLYSQIPEEVGRLRRLQFMFMNNNSLVGDIPANLSGCLNLLRIDLAYNTLSGKIPAQIGSLLKLELLYLFKNNLSGEIPNSLGNLSSLQVLSLAGNHLSGRIPYTLGQLNGLFFFSLANNGLDGTIPLSIFNLSSVESFAINANQLHGNLPLELGNMFPNLTSLRIFDNQFTGPIPPSISNASNLQTFLLYSNYLTGQVPNLEKLLDLDMFVATDNHLGFAKEGDLRFLSTLTNATRLHTLLLGGNNLGGFLPDSIANLSASTLRNLAFESNQIVGKLPANIGNLESLEIFAAWGNRLSGTIPEDISKLQRLHLLYLHDNEFTGNIPSSIGNLSELNKLILSGNKFHGSIPSSLGKCQDLLLLSIAANNLSGSIPSEIFTISSLSLVLNLSQNHLTGPLPMEIGNLKQLGQLDVSQNMLSGAIPSDLGKCQSLDGIGMDGNFFHGTIPSSFVSLRGLQYLNLSHNNLSGDVPIFLEGFALEILDLSFNNFSGMLPSGGVFKNANATSVEGNSMLCGGPPQLNLPICAFGEQKKKRLKLKIVIAIVLAFTLASFLVITSLTLWWVRRKREKNLPSSSENSILQVSYQTLSKATDGFSSTNLIGVGSYASVYRGTINLERSIAVKVFNLQRRGASKSFMVECEALRKIRHRNLVKVITACSSIDSQGNDFKALIYEFMDNGSLEKWLHPASGLDDSRETTRSLNLRQRLNIAIDVACALDYLHNGYSQTPIAHCDLKPSNILLDDEMTAQVGDFGLVKFLSEGTNNLSANQTSSTGVRGTVGYAAPEYGMGSEVSTHGDMYSYGILLLEMFTGKKPTDDMFDDNMNIHNYVKMALPDQVAKVTEATLLEGREEDANDSKRNDRLIELLIVILRIGISCSEEMPGDRMDSSAALAKLIAIRESLIGNGADGGQGSV